MTTAEITASTRQVAEGVKSCSSLLDARPQRRRLRPDRRAVQAVVEGEMTAADMLTSPDLARGQARRGTSGARRPARSSQVSSARQVVPQVVDVLDADRHPHQSVGDGGRLGLPTTASLEGRLDPAEAGGVHPQRASCGSAGRPPPPPRRARPRRSRRSRGSGPRRRPGAPPAGGPAPGRWPGRGPAARAACAGPAAPARSRTCPAVAPTRSRRLLQHRVELVVTGWRSPRAARRCDRR